MIMEKINVAELLLNCPKDMELDCVLSDNVELDCIDMNCETPIRIVIGGKRLEYLTAEGYLSSIAFGTKGAKCVIFPKGKTSWEGFVPPCKFKDGDIIYNQCIKATAIFYKQTNDNTISHCFLNAWKELKTQHKHCKLLSNWRLATEEEKEKLFEAIKDNGYKWDNVTKVLYKIVEPKFKIGDIIKDKCNLKWKVIDVNSHYYEVSLVLTGTSKLLEIKAQDDWELVPNESEKLIESEFKNGDVIACENHWGQFISIFKENVTERNGFIGHCVLDVDDNEFKVKDSASYFNKARLATKREKELLFRAIKKNGYKWNEDTKTLEKSTPNKFDINTLVPFESKVLVRDSNKKWRPAIYGFCNKFETRCAFYVVGGCVFEQCIPFENNEHLIGKIDDCDEYFKTWK